MVGTYMIFENTKFRDDTRLSEVNLNLGRVGTCM